MEVFIQNSGFNHLSGVLMLFLGLWMALWILLLIYSIMYLVSMYKVFEKCGKNGWYSLIPFYNNWVLFEIAGIDAWLSLIPFVNVVFMYIAFYRIFSKFDKTSSYAILATIFYQIFIPVVAFSNTEYDDKEIYHNINYQSGQKNNDNYGYCSNCGLRGDGKFCVKCGSKLK